MIPESTSTIPEVKRILQASYIGFPEGSKTSNCISKPYWLHRETQAPHSLGGLAKEPSDNSCQGTHIIFQVSEWSLEVLLPKRYQCTWVKQIQNKYTYSPSSCAIRASNVALLRGSFLACLPAMASISSTNTNEGACTKESSAL